MKKRKRSNTVMNAWFEGSIKIAIAEIELGNSDKAETILKDMYAELIDCDEIYKFED